MKSPTLYRIAVSALFLFFGALSAFAQTDKLLMVFQVPFDFQVNETVLPAGKYVVRRDQPTPQQLQLHCPERNLWVTVHTIPHSLTKEPTQSSLIFKEYEGRHFLSEVRVPGRGDGYALIKSKVEARLAKAGKTKTIHAGANAVTTNK